MNPRLESRLLALGVMDSIRLTTPAKRAPKPARVGAIWAAGAWLAVAVCVLGYIAAVAQ